MKMVRGKLICLMGLVSFVLLIVYFVWPVAENRQDLVQKITLRTSSSDVHSIQLEQPTANPGSIERKREFHQEILVLKPGKTLIELLRAAGTSYREAFAASISLSEVLDPRELRAGQRFSVVLWPNKEDPMERRLARLSVVPEIDKRVVVEREVDERFSVREERISHSFELTSTKVTVQHSLYEAARDEGVPIPVVIHANRVLGQTVDLERDINEGDMIFFGYEICDDGEDLGMHPGNLVYVSLRTAEGQHSYFRYETSDGFESYFDEDGNSIETGLMKTPVSAGRLSSAYGKRKHPTLGYTRMHKGLDFAATLGTPVLAAGNGKIVERRRNGSFGKYIRIQHDNELASAYAHLASYEKTLVKGDRVRRGDVIGYVGETGLTTGPNLHFEVLKAGQQLNPARIAAPPQKKLEGQALSRFQRKAAELKALLDIPILPRNADQQSENEISAGSKG